MSLYEMCIDHAVKTKQERRVVNYLLIQLGLMRSEQKCKTSFNIKSCQYALRETLNKKSLGSDYMKNVLTLFLDKMGV